MYKLICTLLILVWISITSLSQEPALIFRHLTRNNGLPVEKITCLAQDSTGFMWIGTNDGLFKFDGFNYKAFYSSPRKDAMLHSDYILKLYTDSRGRLWIATYDKGLSMLKSGLNQMSQVTCNIAGNPPITPTVWDIKEDKKGFLWFATYQGLLRLSPDGTWKIYKPDLKPAMETNVNQFQLGQFAFDPEGRLLIGGYAGLWIFDPLKEKFVYPAGGLKQAFEKRWCFRALAYNHDRVWFSTWALDLGVYNTSTNKLRIIYKRPPKKLPDLSKMAWTFYSDSKSGIWIVTEHGLHLVSAGSDTITRSYFHDPQNSNSLVSNSVNTVLEDREGNLWVGTDEGISITKPYTSMVQSYSINALHDFPFGDKPINNIIELANHNFLLTTQRADGIYLTDRNFVVQQHFKFSDVKYDWIFRHYQDKKTGIVYISTLETMLEFNQGKNSIRLSTDSFFSTRSGISCMIQASEDEIWICHSLGQFCKYNLRTHAHKDFNIAGIGEQPPQVILLRKDLDNNLWILGHTSGLLRFDEQKQKIVERLVPDSSINSIRQSGIWVFLDLGESFLIGYDTHGISLYHKKTKRFEHFTSTEGLVSNLVRDAFVAADKTVWIATANGISHFNPEKKTFINYNQEQGILQNSFNCIFPVSDGRIVAGTDKGVIVFDPDQISLATPSPPVITEIMVLDKKISMDSLTRVNQSLLLSYKENYFSFDFISPQYSNSSLVEYAYMLEGLETKWNFSGHRRFVSYANIPAGNYTFKLKCRVPGGQWIQSSSSVHITMQSAFYKRWWFFLIIGLVTAAMVYTFFRYRLNKLLQLERMRTAISNDLHDEVGATLTSISIFSEMAKKTVLPLSKEDEYLQRIGDRSRESIDKMSDIIWSINPNNDSLEQMLVRMKIYTTELTEAKDIMIHWNETGDLPNTKLSMEGRKNIYLLYKEAVNNVIKHSCAKNIYILVQSFRNNLSLVIRDDGKGFDVNSANVGNGLKSIKRRAALLKGTIKIVSDNGCGTSIHLTIPFK